MKTRLFWRLMSVALMAVAQVSRAQVANVQANNADGVLVRPTAFFTGNAAALRSAVLPPQTGQGGRVLGTDGSALSWVVNGGGGSGTGTVTNVSVVTANGISGSVANATSTPAITLTLGAITPVTVNGNTITTGTGTLTIGAAKVFTVSNTLTLTATDGATLAIGGGGTLGSAAYTASGSYVPSYSGLTTNGVLQATSATTVASTLTPAGLTSVGTNAVNGAAATDLTLTGGSSGASVTLGALSASNATATITSAGTGNVIAANNRNGESALKVSNSTSGTGAYSLFQLVAGSTTAGIYALSQGYSSSGDYAAGTMVFSNPSGYTFASGAVTKIKDTTSSTGPTAGALQVGGGTAATNVGIGGGNVNAGATVKIASPSTAGTSLLQLANAVSTVTPIIESGDSARSVMLRSFTSGAGLGSWTLGYFASSTFTQVFEFSVSATNSSSNNYFAINATGDQSGGGTGALQVSGGGSFSKSVFIGTTIDVANADTSIGRAGAGQISVESVAVPTISSTDTLTNKRITARITSITSSATPTVNTDNCDCVTITALAATITSMTSSLTGTPVNFDQLEYRIKDNGTARGITWGASFVAGPAALPTTTVISKALHVWFEWDSVQSAWVCLATGSDS